MLKHVWSVLCRDSIISSDDNSLSINKVLEGLDIDIVVSNDKKSETAKVIQIPIEYELVSYLVKEDLKDMSKENAVMRVSLVDPKGKLLNTVENPVEMPEGNNKLRARLKLQGMGLTKTGDYVFRVEMRNIKGDYKIVTEIPLTIKIKGHKEPPKKG